MRGERRHAELVDVDVELVGVEAVGIDGGVGAEGYFDAGGDGLFVVGFSTALTSVIFCS